MLGDKYQVFTSTGNYTHPEGTFDTWREAKEVRNDRFFHDEQVQSAWIMRCNPSMNLRQDKYGYTLRKEKHRAQQNTQATQDDGSRST